MDFEIIVRNLEDGTFIVACPSYPDCEASGASVEDALEKVIEKIADRVADNVKAQMKAVLQQIPREIARNQSKGGLMDKTLSLHNVMAEIPISLN